MRILPTILSFVILACASADEPRGQVKKTDDILLGGVFNTQGAQADLDVPTSLGARLAVAEINDAGGVLGKQLTLVAEDGKSRTATVAKRTAKILKQYPSVSAIVGLSDTDMVLAAAPVAAEAERLFLTSGATSPQLPGQVPQYLYLACFGDNVQAAAAAEFAFERLGARSASVLYDSTDTYTNLLQDYFRTRFQELGGQIISAEAYTPGDLSGPISRLQQADIVFLSAHLPPDAVAGVEQLRAAGFNVPILGGDGFDDEATWEEQTGAYDVYFTTHVYLGADATDPQVMAFRTAYEDANPGFTATGFAALGYDAVQLVAEAMRIAGSSAPADVVAAMGLIQNFDGVTGTISYDAGSRIPRKSVAIIEIDGGAYSLAEDWTPTGVPAP